MKKCILCKKKIRGEKDLCNSCKEFLKWKHKGKYKDHIEKIKNYFSKSIKFRGAK